jgi:hypothetical protein
VFARFQREIDLKDSGIGRFSNFEYRGWICASSKFVFAKGTCMVQENFSKPGYQVYWSGLS